MVAGGGGTAADSILTENDTQTANYTAPTNLQKVVITMYDDAPPVWQGEIQSAFGNVGFATYERILQVLDPHGNVVQAMDLNFTEVPMGATYNSGACSNGYADCDRGITGYTLEHGTQRGNTSGIVSPDGQADNLSYNYIATDPNQTASLTLYNVPVLYKFQIGTSFNFCLTSTPMPKPGTGSWSGSSPVSCPGRFAAQGGANTGGTYGDTRYIISNQVVNRSAWHTDYRVNPTASSTADGSLPPQSCPAMSYQSGVSGCSWNIPTGSSGQTGSNYYNTNATGSTHTACQMSAVCGGDYTTTSQVWHVSDSSAAGVSDGGGVTNPPCPHCVIP